MTEKEKLAYLQEKGEERHFNVGFSVKDDAMKFSE
jgi:hypothetical protein